jgi:hypothetical protein
VPWSGGGFEGDLVAQGFELAEVVALGADHGQKADSVAFQALVEAAGGTDHSPPTART